MGVATGVGVNVGAAVGEGLAPAPQAATMMKVVATNKSQRGHRRFTGVPLQDSLFSPAVIYYISRVQIRFIGMARRVSWGSGCTPQQAWSIHPVTGVARVLCWPLVAGYGAPTTVSRRRHRSRDEPQPSAFEPSHWTERWGRETSGRILDSRRRGLVWSRFHERFSALFSNVAEVVLASERTIHFALLGLFAGGHILLEDLPGVGKTLLGKTIAQSIAGQFSRIQFTPDLLPTDITGSSIFDMRNNRFEFVPSPIFANSVLADEVNRMGPRTQSALLEAMGESQVTVDGAVRELPWPFMVVATQNLAESYGVFPLPNSQLDRFMISMNMGLPTPQQEVDILSRSEFGVPEVTPVLSADDVAEMQGLVRQVQVALPVKQYIVNLVASTRQHGSAAVGVSPRGAVSLLRAAQEAFDGRDFVVPEDVKEVALRVMAHRILVDGGAGLAARNIICDLLDSTPVPL